MNGQAEKKIRGYRCKECKFETSVRGWKNAQFEIENHIKAFHLDIYKKIQSSELQQNIEIKKVERRYPLIVVGQFINMVYSKPPKLWKCPRCKKEMGRHHKFYHEANAFRNGKENQCIVRSTTQL